MAVKKTRKRRVKKNIESGVAHIHSTFNNTLVKCLIRRCQPDEIT